MISENPKVDLYFIDGCGRCPLGGTINCKVNNWKDELKLLRMIVLDCGLTEELKWGVPVYTFQNHNIVILAAFKEYCALSFFKGTLLNDENKILSKPGENTQSARLIKFTDVREIIKMKSILKATIFEAIELEKAGLKVKFKKKSEHPIPIEFNNKLKIDPALKSAFDALTPGRQRAYLLYFSAPKQSKTRESRIEKSLKKILKGKGLTDN